MTERCNNCQHTCFSDKPKTRDPKKRSIRMEILFNYVKSLFCDGKSKPDTFYIIVEGDIDQKFWEKIGKSDTIIIKRIRLPNGGDTSVNNPVISSNPYGKYVSTNKSAIECLFCTENIHFLPESIKKTHFEKNFVLGMVDMDFQHPEQPNLPKNDPDINIQYDPKGFYPLFRTETRDIEILLCKLGALHFFLIPKIGSKNAAATEEELQNLASVPGYGRFLNAEHDSRISFKLLKKESNNWVNPFCKYIHLNEKLDCDNIIDLLKMDTSNIMEINEKNRAKKSLFFTLYRYRCSKRKQLVSGNLWSICQGHDTMQIFECMCKKYPHLFSISDKVLSNQILDEFFNSKCYRRSEMIAQIIEWEKMNHHSNFDRENQGKIFIKSVYDEFNQNNADQNNPSFKNPILLK